MEMQTIIKMVNLLQYINVSNQYMICLKLHNALCQLYYSKIVRTKLKTNKLKN